MFSGALGLQSSGRCIRSDAQRGRWLYYVEHQQEAYWLKLQQSIGDLQSETAFLHELAFYQKMQQAVDLHHKLIERDKLSVCLPFDILDVASINDAPVNSISQVLCIRDSQTLFSTSEDLSLSDQIHRLILSLTVLERLYGCGYLHGDLKNTHFRLHQNQCYLIDFEQSMNIDAARAVEQTATPRYMAPELFHAQPKSVQSDIYALGVIWLQWLNQQRWFNRSYLDWAYWHCQQLEVELVDRFSMLKPILMRMLAKKKSNRYAAIEEIKLDLARIV